MLARFIPILALALSATGCVTGSGFDAKAPEQFATLDSEGEDKVVLKAVSPSGVVYRVRTEQPEPKAELSFWKEALQSKLAAEGYVVLAVKDTTLAGQPAAAIEAVAPLADADYGFMVLIAPVGEEILIVEGAGERKAWDTLKPKMLAAAEAIQAHR